MKPAIPPVVEEPAAAVPAEYVFGGGALPS